MAKSHIDIDPGGSKDPPIKVSPVKLAQKSIASIRKELQALEKTLKQLKEK